MCDPTAGNGDEPVSAFAARLLRDDMATLQSLGPHAGERPATREGTVDFIRRHLAASGHTPFLHRFGDAPGDCNILAERSAADPGGPLFEIGAGFDAGDFNSGGIVCLLAIARHFAEYGPQRNLRFCFFGGEAGGRMGCRAHQSWLREDTRAFDGCIVLGPIGGGNTVPHSRRGLVRVPFLPSRAGNGDLITVVTNPASRGLVARFRRVAAQGRGVSISQEKAYGGLIRAALGGDPEPYWQAGRPAIRLTGTAGLRVPPHDKPASALETVNFDFLSALAQAVALVAAGRLKDSPAP